MSMLAVKRAAVGAGQFGKTVGLFGLRGVASSARAESRAALRKGGVLQVAEQSLQARVRKLQEKQNKSGKHAHGGIISGGGGGGRYHQAYHTMQHHGLEYCSDLLVIGCGIAGSAAALKAATMGLKVTMLTAAHEPRDCNSYWAQGGIIYRAKDDLPELLADDVHSAGAGICDHDAVMKLAEDGPARVEELLIDLAKVPFDRNPDGELALCLEANHNRPRIIHWRDQTGRAITESVQSAVFHHPNIRVLTGANVVDLALTHDSKADNGFGFGGVQCVGAHVLMQESKSESGSGLAPATTFQTLLAKATVLATGGLGDLYEHTSNPSSARGAGFAIALRAGAALRNMEFVQFHPTTVSAGPDSRSFLLTEALRGEGAILRDETGRNFACDYHPQGELAPRDVVSRMIVSEMERQGGGKVYLDITHRDPEWIRNRFPGVYQGALALGFDISTSAVPVVPAAHYFCGGVMTDLHGRTTVPGLLCAGEVACTGLHGGNRLASTSLLEGLVWGCSLAEHLVEPVQSGTNVTHLEALTASAGQATLLSHEHHHRPQDLLTPTDDVRDEIDAIWAKLRRTMTESVGVVRTKRGVNHALKVLDDLYVDASRVYKTSRLSTESVEVRNACETAGMIAQAAAANPHSVGAHYMVTEPTEQEVVMRRQILLEQHG